MRKINLVMAMLAISMVTFAQGGGTITYELNGGVTNDDGWQNKEDMYQGLYQSWNTFKGGGQTAWTPLETLIAENDSSAENAVPKGIPTVAASMDLTFIQDETVKAKWQWLVDYMDAVCTEQEKTLPSSSAAFLRYNLSAFFLNSVRPGWPASADYKTAGQPEAFMPTWKHGFAGPASYDGTTEVAIPAPYKEGFTFGGWYDNAEFSGNAIATTTDLGASGNKTLYAKWTEYIPTCAEVWALGTDSVATKAAGTVTYAYDKNVYIQDATAGLYIYFTTAPEGIVAGDYIVVSGETDEFSGQFEVAKATLVSKTAGTLPAAQNVTVSGLLAAPDTYMYEYVQFTGARIAKYDGKNAYLTDGTDTVMVYSIDLDQEAFPVRTRVNATLTVCTYNGTTQLKGYAENVVAAPLAGKDPYAYPEKDGYTLENEWLFSNVLDNLAANMVGTNGFVRGMVAKDDIMYFVDREHTRLVVVDGKTGEMLEPIKLDSKIFTYEQNAGTDSAEVVTAGTLPFNDMKIDGAGNILLGNCITSNKQPFQVWKINLADGTGTLVVNEILGDNPDLAEANIRFDAFGVYGDVDADAIIMASNASALEAYKWTITGGKAGAGELIELDVSGDEFLAEKTNPGSAPQIFPVDETYFYLDGNETFPTLFNMDGEWMDGFQNNRSLLEPSMIVGTDTAKLTLNEGHNGLCEFQIGNEYFIVMAARNTVASNGVASAFALYKFADASKSMADMEPLWFFPRAGMGGASNAYRTAVPSVEVTDNVAKIYVYTGENGYGVYTLTAPQTALKENRVPVLNISPEGLLSETVAQVEVYAVSGQCVFAARNVNAISVPMQGVYVVKALRQNGEQVVEKYLAK